MIERHLVYLDGSVAKGWEDQQEPAQATAQYVDPMHSAFVPQPCRQPEAVVFESFGEGAAPAFEEEDQQEPARATSQYVDPMHSAPVPQNK